ncbi:uncharacterized protein AB675_11792 [Cyphellophora attinorum]|uniref:HTH CENPB-type domain-containing protein n=1 Tax=Cyphellophora attinorum TaxID=1664694 RepID=A0A0N1GZV3_9EURO|nr:uncharacterized protein AB675_11792 [Phialophora attinorum]KPI36742.1 hypothetical protein AB675_11792 [Phialophora attinorum]
MSPMHDYSQFDYHQPPASLPGSLEPACRIARPPPYAAGVPQMPPPLITSHNVLWPSMIASGAHPSGGHPGSYQPPVLAAAPIHTPLSAGTISDVTPTSAKSNTSRRKLTDEERRQMCLEAEQNPSMKQTQIGAKFNVERSTVSKILRQKDKYINLPPLEDVVSPGKKSKAKLPDFEKTLANWVRNQQRNGIAVGDEDLKRQAKKFSFSRSDQALLSSTSWLEKFKQKNQLGKYTDTATDSTVTTQTETSPFASPASSEDVKAPASALDDDAVKDDNDQFFDFVGKSEDFFEDPSGLSPLSDEAVQDDDVMTELPSRPTFRVPSGTNLHRQRSQTLSNLDDYASTSTMSRPTPTAMDSKPPMTRALTTSLTMQSHVDPAVVKRHKSVPDIHEDVNNDETVHFTPMHAPPLPQPYPSVPSESVSPVSITNPISPADDDHLKALHAIKKALEDNPGLADPDDYLAIGKLMEKVKLIRSPTQSNAFLHTADGKGGRKRGYMGIS